MKRKRSRKLGMLTDICLSMASRLAATSSAVTVSRQATAAALLSNRPSGVCGTLESV